MHSILRKHRRIGCAAVVTASRLAGLLLGNGLTIALFYLFDVNLSYLSDASAPKTAAVCLSMRLFRGKFRKIYYKG